MFTDSEDSSSSSGSTWDKVTLVQVRSGLVKSVFGPGMRSAIFKSPIDGPVQINKLGCVNDEHSYIGHGGLDKAFLWYNADHYDSWKLEIPEHKSTFVIGAYGENLVTKSISEQDVCIGDVVRVGAQVIIAIAEPRQPCYMLNHRFKIKDMSKRSQDTLRTGWYCRVLQEGNIQAGDDVCLVSRPNPHWPVSRAQHYLYRDMKNEEAMTELSQLSDLGQEIRDLFSNRLRKQMEDQQQRLLSYDETFKDPWSDCIVVARSYETPKVLSLVFERAIPEAKPSPVLPGSHIRLKLGTDLVRAYSVVSGDENRFELGIALSENSRGGSAFVHNSLKIGDNISASNITASFPLHADADNHVLIAGGIGLTAFISAAKECQSKAIPFHLHYLVRNDADIAFNRYLDVLGEYATIYDSSRGKRCDIGSILKKANSLTHVYCCGSERLMSDVKRIAGASGLSPNNLHFETFTTNTSGDPFKAKVAGSDQILDIPGRKTLLDVLREVGLEVPSSCEVGNCGTCQVTLKCGRIEHRGTGLMDWEKGDKMLACVSRGIGDIEIEL